MFQIFLLNKLAACIQIARIVINKIIYKFVFNSTIQLSYPNSILQNLFDKLLLLLRQFLRKRHLHFDMKITMLPLMIFLGHTLSLYYFPLIWLYNLIRFTFDYYMFAIQMQYCFLEAKERLLQAYIDVNIKIITYTLELFVLFLFKSKN